jgi:glycosyltransferase involved in cell wall biosynthesis
MKILQINTHSDQGGAAQVMTSLHRGYEKNGHISRIASAIIHKNETFIDQITTHDSKVRRYLGKKLGLEDVIQYKNSNLTNLNSVRSADVIQLHNIHGYYFNLFNIIKLSNQTKLFWTLHDMWPLTGHCAHSFDCTKWKSGCFGCPYLNTYPAMKHDLAFLGYFLKQLIYKQAKFKIICPSKWLYDLASKSILSDQVIFHIPNGVDNDYFKPSHTPTQNTDKLRVLFVANGGVENHWKGGDYFKLIVNKLETNPKVKFTCVGGSENIFTSRNLVNIGYLSSRDELKKIYQNHDLLLTCSRADNFPLNILEALSCGLPVIAFNVGGIKEVVSDKTGFLIQNNSVPNTVKIINMISNHKHYLKILSENAIKLIQKDFTLDKQIRSYLSLYESS